MNRSKRLATALAALAGIAVADPAASRAEPLIWGVQAEEAEYRLGDNGDAVAWDLNAQIGYDELRLFWRNEGEYGLDEDRLESLETRVWLQAPISDFFDAVAGARVDTPDGPHRTYGLLGIHGLAPQWFEIDADLFLSEHPSFRLEVEYEALITNRLILTPSVEFDLPFTDDAEIGQAAWGPSLEVGARLSYDVVDRAISPYVGVHYERVFGSSADLARADGEAVDGLFFVTGIKAMY